jgi:hypothetical protein
MDSPLVGVWEKFDILQDSDKFYTSRTSTLEYESNGNFSLKIESISETTFDNETKTNTYTSIYSGTYSTNNDIIIETQQKKLFIINDEIKSENEIAETFRRTFLIENDILTLKFADVGENVVQDGVVFNRI